MTPKEKKEVQELFTKSGNSFHSRVVKLLRDEKWTVLVSPYYSDNFTDKPREIDIISERPFDVEKFGWMGTANASLFIECKYINTKTIFWFDVKDKIRAIERIMKDTGLEHPNQNTNIKAHHYFSDLPVAKLFTSAKGSEDNDIIGKAINQNLNALVYYRNHASIIPPERGKAVNVLKKVPYPMIVVNSFQNFYRVNMADPDGEIEQITEPFHLEVNYAYIDKEKNSRNEFFLIDVVSYDKLSEHLSMIEKTDVAIISQHCAWEEGVRKNREQNRNTPRYNNSAQ
jgi:hypothetical protein